MTLREAIKNRHSVRKYLDMPITGEMKEKLDPGGVPGRTGELHSGMQRGERSASAGDL